MTEKGSECDRERKRLKAKYEHNMRKMLKYITKT